MERREAGSNQAKAVLQRYLRCVLRLLEDRGPEWCQHWGWAGSTARVSGLAQGRPAAETREKLSHEAKLLLATNSTGQQDRNIWHGLKNESQVRFLYK